MCHGQLYQQRMKKAFDKKVKPRVFREGDLVLKKVLSFVPDSRGKWTPNYEGPYVVKRAFSGGALMLTTMDGEDFARPVNSDAPSFRQRILDSSLTEASHTSRFKLVEKGSLCSIALPRVAWFPTGKTFVRTPGLVCILLLQIWLLGLFPKQRFGCWGCSLSRASVDFDSPKQKWCIEDSVCSPAVVSPRLDCSVVQKICG
ncbi:hypothetical protein KIW84_035389 [Lathyrus oleraceus]|uniref:Uncharacterized protein n=1 Tax=Pisum sativum TaxID=3888 RepID=A0A9D4Y6G8_PEA|nr:hypothetical protein KIW84_035389 [Pisum sativum]